MPEINPLVSIIVRTKDRPALLKAALRSVAAQDYRPIEVILINDGGCDLDIDIVKNILNGVSLNYVRFEKNRGRAAAGNEGIVNARGKYTGFLDDDDELLPDHLNILVSLLEKTDYKTAYADSEFVVKEVDAELGQAKIQDRRGFSSYDFSYKDLIISNYIPLISILFRSDILRQSGGFDESFELYEDWDLLLRIGSDYPFYHIKKVTSIYNQWDAGQQIAQSAKPFVIKNALSQIIDKHRGKITGEVIQNVNQKEQALTDSLKDMIQKYASLENELAQKNSELLQKYAELSQKDTELLHRNAELSLKDSELLRKDTELHQKDTELFQKESEIAGLRESNAVIMSELHSVHSTLGWRALTKIRKARDKIIPLGTARWKLYHKAVEWIKSTKKWEKAVDGLIKVENETGVHRDAPCLEIEAITPCKDATAEDLCEAIGTDTAAEELETESLAEDVTTQDLNEVIGTETLTEGLETVPLVEDVGTNDYDLWIREHEPTEADLLKQRQGSRSFLYKPFLSIIVPVFETDKEMLTKMIESVMAQTYENWQLCIADGNSSNPHVREVIESFAGRDGRIKVKFLEDNRHISGNSNEALSLAEGEFVGFLDHDDELAPFALYEVVRLLNDNPVADFIYSDEDRIDSASGRSFPFFKPDWSPDLLLSVNYICHFTVLRTGLVRALGGFRGEYDGAQDYDLFLRASDVAPSVAHIPKILYHWREHEKSTAGSVSRKDYADTAGRGALTDFLNSKRIDADVDSPLVKTYYRVRYRLKDASPVSIVIPFRDRADLLKRCVISILEKTVYKNYELILVSNKSSEEQTFRYLDSLRNDERIKILNFAEEFNFSKINNFAVKVARGEYLLFLNNDAEVINDEWLTLMLEHSQRKEVGAVGCKLLFPDRRIQHAGVIIGMTGFAGHVFAGLPEHFNNFFGSTDFVRNVTAVTGACMMVRRDVFDEVGGFDESFTICGSDVDLCLKILGKGYRNIYTPFAVLYHHESVSRGSFIPPEDFNLSMTSYRKFIHGRDPYYNPNLTLIGTDCSLKRKGEDNILEAAREHALKEGIGAGVVIEKEQVQPKTNATIMLVEALDFSADDLTTSRCLMSEFERNRPAISSINWFIPYFYHVYYGGIYTILRFADFFSKKGIKNRFVLYDSPAIAEDDISYKIKSAFPDMRNPEVFICRDPDVNTIPYADISIASLWTSAYRLLKFRNTLGKFYFIQDYEPLFYPAGTSYALAEATYRFGFHGIVNTPGLYDFGTGKYDMTAEYFIPAIDHHIFFPVQKSFGGEDKKLKLFFYGRPQHDRNAFDLAVAAAKKIRTSLGEKIEIVSAGSEWNPSDYGVEGIIKNLGLLRYKETADLYRTSDFGLILMFTKHPSYLPMELMASGSVVVTNHNKANAWLLKDGTNCIEVEPSPTYIMEKLSAVIANPELRRTIRNNALRTAASFTWEHEMEKIYGFITGKHLSYMGSEEYKKINSLDAENGSGRAADECAHSETAEILRQKGRDFDRLIRTIREKDERIGDLERAAREKEADLNDIYRSHGWKALSLYYKARDRIFPVGSGRRKVAQMLWRLLNKAKPGSARLLTKNNIRKSVFYIRTYGLRSFLKKTWAHANSESMDYSHKPTVPLLNLTAFEEDEIVPINDAVSVVIPTKNAGSDFELLLSMINGQKGLREIEIVVVDSGSSDNTVETAKAYGAKIVEIPPEKFSHSYARNMGAESSATSSLFFTVQDALPPSDLFLYELFQVLQNNGVSAVSCAEFPREDVDLFYGVLSWNHYRFLEVDKNDRILSLPKIESHIALRKNGQLSDVACLISRDLFMKYKYRNDYAEDLDLGIRLIRDGYKIAFLNSVQIIHSHNRPPFYFLRRAYVDNLFLTKIFPDYQVPTVQGDMLLKEILNSNSLISFIFSEVDRIETPISVAKLFGIIEKRLRSFDYLSSSVPSANVDALQMDDGFKSFLRKISEISLAEKQTPRDGILVNAVLNFMGTAREYMASTYEVIDDDILEDFKSLIVKTYALQCGAHLAYCYMNNGGDMRYLHEILKEGI